MAAEHVYLSNVETVHAFRYAKGMEDGFKSPHMGVKGTPWIRTILGRLDINEGDWIVIHKDGSKEKLPEHIFEKRYTKAFKERE